MNLAVAVVAIFGVFNLIGGVIGYLKAKSSASLIAGSVAGVILLICAYGIAHDHRAAAITSLAVSILLGARFAGTWRRNHRVMPDLLMIALSLVTLLIVGRLQLIR